MPTATAAVFEKPGQIALCSFPIPSAKPGEILVRNTLCTICGSDLHTYEGRRGVDGPTVLGHEILGVVEEVEGDLLDFDGEPIVRGDRIVWSLCVSCWECDRCTSGLPQKCRYLKKYGHQAVSDAHALSGGLATHTLLLPKTDVFRVPDEIPDAVACPAGCATATIAGAFRQAGVVSGQTVLILGAGILGLTACAVARSRSANHVVAVDINPHRLELARSFGADLCLHAELSEAEFEAQIEALTGKNRVDVVLELSGAPASMELGLNLLDIGGRLLLIGAVFPVPAVSILPEQVIRRHQSILGVHNYHPRDLAMALRFLSGAGQTYPFAELVFREFPLQEIQMALDFAVREKPFRIGIRP